MITSTMTADEVLKVFDQDYDRIRAYLHHKQKTIRRELLKNRRESTMRCYDYSTNNADYTLNVLINKKGDAYVNTFAYVKDSNEYLFMIKAFDSPTIMSFSVHLFKRYAERELKNTELTMNEIINEFNKYLIFVTVYSDDEGRRVFAMRNGLLLGKYDKKRDMLVHKTYVSSDMLKESQYKAWEIISVHVKQLLEYRKLYGFQSLQAENYKNKYFYPGTEPLSVQLANSIYSQFYDSKQ